MPNGGEGVSDTRRPATGRVVAGGCTVVTLVLLVYLVGVMWVVAGVTALVIIAGECARGGTRRKRGRRRTAKRNHRQNRKAQR